MTETFSKRQIVEAGKIICGRPQYNEETLEAFRVANHWRSMHVGAMRGARSELSRSATKADEEALTAARLKRMQSIRRKMRRRPVTLHQMQDIAGCRAIMPSMEGVERLLEFYRGGSSRHLWKGETDYISRPKNGGYRSSHVILKVSASNGRAASDTQSVEIQVRTKLQHAWATAVEAVGLVRNEQLKTGLGDTYWLRFFEIMSSEFAAEEKRPLIPGVPDERSERLVELRDLERHLDAVKTLESYNQAIRYAENFDGLRGHSFLIEYDGVTKTVAVHSNPKFSRTMDAYCAAEKEGRNNTVVVEVDKVDDLVAAYPNYFLDVSLFTERLKRAIFSGRAGRQNKWGWLKDYVYPRRLRESRNVEAEPSQDET